MESTKDTHWGGNQSATKEGKRVIAIKRK